MPRNPWIDRALVYDADNGGSGGGDGGGSGDGGQGGGAGGSGGAGDTLEELKSALDKERDRASTFEKTSKQQSGQLKSLQEELDKLKQQSMSDAEKAIEQARKEAAEQTRSDVAKEYDRRVITAEVKAVAAGKLSDPADAVRFLDLDEFKVDKDGEVDTKAIGKAVDQLLKDKPYLASGAPKRNGSGDGGARGSTGGGGSGDWLGELARGKR